MTPGDPLSDGPLDDRRPILLPTYNPTSSRAVPAARMCACTLCVQYACEETSAYRALPDMLGHARNSSTGNSALHTARDVCIAEEAVMLEHT